jgi:hypothetical protein
MSLRDWIWAGVTCTILYGVGGLALAELIESTQHFSRLSLDLWDLWHGQDSRAWMLGQEQGLNSLESRTNQPVQGLLINTCIEPNFS